MNPHLSIAAASGGFAWPLVILYIAILANAFFAASEIAVVSLNKTKIRKQAEDGDKTSKLMLNFIEEPGRFLSTIQIGVTLAGFLASAFAAVTFAEPAAAWATSQDWCKLSFSTVQTIMTVLVTIALS